MSKISIDINGNTLFDADNIRLSILRCNQENCSRNKAAERRVREYHSIHFITNGKGTLKCGDREYHLKKGQCFLLFAGEEYCYYPDKSDPWSYIWLDFICDNAEALVARAGLKIETPYLTVKSWDAVHNQLIATVNSFNSHSTQNLFVSGYFFVVLANLIEDFSKLESYYKGKDAHKFRYVRDAIIFMNNNHRIDISLNDVAESANSSPTYLTAMFADEIGISPMHYLTLFRIANACEKLKENKYIIAEVSNQTGFKDPLYFSRCFSKVMGMSPRQYVQSNPDDDPYKFFKDNNIYFS